jgi:hypothetical protein
MLSKKFGPDLDTKEGLERLYNSTSTKDICNKFHINEQLLYRRLKLFKIKTKAIAMKDKLTKEWFEENYYNKKLSILELSKLANVSLPTIHKFKKKYKIKGRSFHEAGLLRSEAIRTQMKKQWSNPIYIKTMANGFSSIKEKMANLAQNQLGKISSIQKILYSILDDLKIKYEPEKVLGFWTYDCLLPEYNLLIECQGNYWYSIKKAITNDTAKATYLENYFPQFKLKHIWEHEFLCKDRIIELIKYWTGKQKLEVINYDFKELILKEITDEEAKLFIAKFHYFGRIGRNSTKYGVFHNNTLIAICAFANITRNETAIRLGLKSYEMRELTRFCIHPSYQKPNLATWFLSRCINLIKIKFQNLKKLVSFSDTTYNHCGTIYKASNWILDGIVKPDYWYCDKDGYIMHKKTLWDHALKMGKTEQEYSYEYGYQKIWGKEKHRYIFNL